jgi:carbon monoxide dehydrogenase subunit G
MVHVQRTFTVDRPAEQVLDYLADFGHAETWDPGTQSCTRIDDGPIAPGARWHNVSKIAGATTELTYELRERVPGKLVLVGTNDTATSTDTITAVDVDGGRSEVTYAADIALNGAAKLVAPAMKLVMERLGGETVTGITDAVARL